MLRYPYDWNFELDSNQVVPTELWLAVCDYMSMRVGRCHEPVSSKFNSSLDLVGN